MNKPMVWLWSGWLEKGLSLKMDDTLSPAEEAEDTEASHIFIEVRLVLLYMQK